MKKLKRLKSNDEILNKQVDVFNFCLEMNRRYKGDFEVYLVDKNHHNYKLIHEFLKDK
jgi:hypothetical protein